MKQEYETAEETLEYFQEDFNPSNPYGRNYKHKKPTGKAAKKAREADPRQASAEKGEKYFKAVTQKVAQFYIEVAKTAKQEFYI